MRTIWTCTALAVLLAGCTEAPPGVPELAQEAVERYLTAWQTSDWSTIYRREGQSPGSRPVLHKSLTDHLDFFSVNEVRYADSTAACAVTLRWRTQYMTYAESGELYMVRRRGEWFVTGFRSF